MTVPAKTKRDKRRIVVEPFTEKLTPAQRHALIAACFYWADNPKENGLDLWLEPKKAAVRKKLFEALEAKGLAVLVQYANCLLAKPTLRGIALYLTWTKMPEVWVRKA